MIIFGVMNINLCFNILDTFTQILEVNEISAHVKTISTGLLSQWCPMSEYLVQD